ncbi:MAG TPA: ABC transporter permease [Blastocatellia bacterium]|nr:ABC transporter permease [Blastocatellia bacterium]
MKSRFWRRNRRNEELEDEINSHLRMAARDRLERGEALRPVEIDVRREIGNVELIKEVTRSMWGTRSLEQLSQDLRYGARMMLKRPGFTIVAVIALALGIGANSAIFSVVNSILLRPLPYSQPDRLMTLWTSLKRPGYEKISVSEPEYVDFKQRSKSFEEIASYHQRGLNLTGVDEPERLQGAEVSPNLFATLGVNPLFGRNFLSGEEQPGHGQVVILSHRLWQQRFGSDRSLVGKSITLDGKPFEVVGVMPPGFEFPTRETDIWTPFEVTSEFLSENYRGSHFQQIVGRLKEGVTLQQARAEMDAIADQMAKQSPTIYRLGYGIVISPMRDEIIGDIRPTLLVLFAAVGFVLLIACANVANLLLSRAAARQKEVSVRAALGASRVRLMRQFLTESVLLSLIGGLFGLLLAYWGVGVLMSLAPSNIPRTDEIRLDLGAVAFTIALSLATGIFFGLAPAIHVSKPDLNDALKSGVRGSSDSAGKHRFRNSLVVAEFAMTVVLLVGAGLMIKSFIKLQEVNPGFSTNNIVSLRLVLPQSRYSTFDKQTGFFKEVNAKLASLPGVQSVGEISALPLSGFTNDRSFRIEGRPEIPGQPNPDEEIRFAGPNYFATMGIPLVRGRLFTERDNADAPRVAIIDEAAKMRYWPNEEAIGKRIIYNGMQSTVNWIEIVGIVGNVKHNGPDAKEDPEIYLPYSQPLFMSSNSNVSALFIVVRTALDPSKTIPAIRSEITLLDKDQPISNIKTMRDLLDESVAQRRFSMLLLSIFAAVAVVLASVGIYGIMSYSVTQRTNEIGIRRALGASTGDVFMMIVTQGMKLSAIGVALGVVGAIGLTRLMSTLLFNVQATDPTIFILIASLLVVVALAACVLPARRAIKLDPMKALRYE